MIQKGEELSLVSSEPVLRFPRQFCFVIARQEALVESRHFYPVFLEKVSFQAKPVDSLDYGLQESRELMHQRLHFFIKRLLENIFVQIANQMDQAFLLCAVSPSSPAYRDSARQPTPGKYCMSRIFKLVYVWYTNSFDPVPGL